MFPILISCQSIVVGSVVEKSKSSRPVWVDRVSIWNNGSELVCVSKYESKEDLPKSIKAQIQAKLTCDNNVATYYLEKNKKLSYKYTKKDIRMQLQNCSEKCSKISDMYFEKIAETSNLYSYATYIKMAYPITYKIYR